MLERLLDIRPDERREVVGAFLLLFGVLTGHTLLETARDALFLARLPASHLPWLYLAIAVLALALSRLRPPRGRRIDGRTWLSLWLIASAVVTFVFWISGAARHPWALHLLYVWSGIFATLSVVQFWLLLGRRFTVTQAKRVYGFIGAGSVLGALLGATLASALARTAGTDFLLLAAALVFLVTGALPLVALRHLERPPARRPGQRPRPVGLGHGIGLIRNHPYLRRVGALTFLAAAVLTAVDFIFKSSVAASVPAERLGTFFATFYAGLNAAALVLQFGLVGWLLRVLGVYRALWVLPLLLALGSLGLLLGGGLAAVLFLKGADGGLRHSLQRTSTELLFVPVADGLRARTKPVIDVLGQRGGQAVASLTILVALAAGLGTPVLALGVGVLAGVWVLLAADLKGYYLDLFRATRREGAIETRPGLRSLDLGALETLFAALNSPDDAEVQAALDLLAHQQRASLIPALILYHPSSAVVLQALDIFVAAGRDDILPMCDRLAGHPDPEVRAAVLRSRSRLEPDEERLREATADPQPVVRATALVGLVAGGWMEPSAGVQALRDLAADDSGEATKALARAIRLQPAPAFAPLLVELARRPDAAALVEVSRAMGALGHAAAVAPLIDLLERREVRPSARDALVSIGQPALRALQAALADTASPAHHRRHLPRTISRFDPQAATDILLAHLLDEPDGAVRYKVLRGLGRIRSDHPEVELERRILQEAAIRTLEAAWRLLDWRHILTAGAARDPTRATPGGSLLVELLADKEQQTLERLFRLLGLLYPQEDVERIYRALHGGDRQARSSGRELLESLLEPPLRAPILALLDDLPAPERLARAAPAYRALDLGYDQVVAAILEAGSQSLQCLAAFHIGEIGLLALRARLEALRAERGGLVAETIDAALRSLAAPTARGTAHAS